jgi:hypothetical protein
VVFKHEDHDWLSKDYVFGNPGSKSTWIRWLTDPDGIDVCIIGAPTLFLTNMVSFFTLYARMTQKRPVRRLNRLSFAKSAGYDSEQLRVLLTAPEIAESTKAQQGVPRLRRQDQGEHFNSLQAFRVYDQTVMAHSNPLTSGREREENVSFSATAQSAVLPDDDDAEPKSFAWKSESLRDGDGADSGSY